MNNKCCFFLFLGVFLFSLSSCVKDEYYLQNSRNPGWSPNFAAPLINSRLTMWDILNDYDSSNIIVEDQTHFLYIVYNSQVYSETAESLIQIPDQNITYNFNVNTGGNVAPGDSFVVTNTFNYFFNFPNFQVIDSVFLKAGTLEINISNTFNLPAKIEISFPGTKNGLPFKETVYFSSPWHTHSTGLQNTKIVFDHIGGNNRLPVTFRLVLYGNGNPNNSPYNLGINLNFQNLRFRKIFGYLGQLSFTFNEDTVKIQLYENNFGGIINWEDPRLYLTVYNSFGMPVQLQINYVEAKRTKPPVNTIQITGSGIPNPWNINYPSFSQIGQYISSGFQLNKTNSNINAGFNISPQQVNLLINAISNQFGFAQNFALDTSRLIVDAKVELPMHGTAQGFTIVDTIDVGLGEDFRNAEYIEWVLFKIYAENGFPVDAKVQIYFLDSLNMLVDSLLSPYQQFIHAATPGPAPDYIVTTKYKKTISTIIPKERIMNYNKIKKAVVYARMETYNQAHSIVKIYSYYDLHIVVSAQIQINYR